jgi:hypothetical protein
MEKHERFAELRKGIISKSLINKYNSLCRFILQMTDIDVHKRPNAGAVVKFIYSEIMRLEGNTLGLGVSEVLTTQRSRFYSYDVKDNNKVVRKRDSKLFVSEDSYTFKLVIDGETTLPYNEGFQLLSVCEEYENIMCVINQK